MDLPEALDRGADMVLVADADAAGGQHQIVACAGCVQGVGDRRPVVGQDAEIGDGAAELLQQSGEREAVGVVDRARRRGCTRLAQFVAGREQGDAQAGAHRQPAQADRGREAQILRAQALPGAQDDRAGFDILAGEAPVRALPDARRDTHGAVFRAAVFLHHHGIEAGWHGGAGEDAHRAACVRVGECGRVAGGDPADHRQAGLAVPVEFGKAHGIAVDRRIVVRRY